MKYTALTIGPIHKTLQSVKSTKAIWAASYMFSYLMKEIIKKTGLKKEDVILPYFEENDLIVKFGVGLFPDRLIVKGEIPMLQTIIDKVVYAFAKKVNQDIKFTEDDVVDYLQEYLTIHHLELELKENENVIFKINSLLDTAELKNKIVKNANVDFLNAFFEEKRYNFFVKEEFDNDEKDKDKKRFPSTIEIANSALKDIDKKKFRHYINILFKDNDDVDTQQLFIDEIKSDGAFNKIYRNYQKYITVVQADGDNIGAFIKQLYLLRNKDKLIRKFSENLLKFGKESVELIKKYQGTPIYAGGDDLLFFAPVAHSAIEDKSEKVYVGKSILTLIDQIDEIFHEYFTNYNKEGFNFKSIIKNAAIKPSMSYGVSICYYKFPLNEALTEGVNQLFHVAKKTCNKNAVSYSVLKHSGQHFGTTFHKNDASFKTFNKLIVQQVKNEDYIHAIAHKLQPQQSVFFGIGIEEEEGKRNEKFDNFFKYNFDESIHTIKINNHKELIPFLKQLKQLFKDVYSENRLSKGENDDQEDINNTNLNKIYAALRFIEFLNNKEER